MKKIFNFITLGLAAVATLGACGGASGEVKIGIKDLEGKTTLTQDIFGLATTYICFDMDKTDLGGRLPSDVVLKASDSSVTVDPYGYSREAKDYKWKAVFAKAGDFTITAVYNNKEYSSISYKVQDNQRADVTYRSPSADKVCISYTNGTYETPVDMQSIKIGNRYMHVGARSYTLYVPEGTEGLYRRYVCYFGEEEWKKSRATYDLISVVTTIYSDLSPNFNGLKYKSKAAESLTITTVTSSGSNEKTYDCTKYAISDNQFSVCDIPEFCLCLKTIDGEGTIQTTKIDYTVTSFPKEPTL